MSNHLTEILSQKKRLYIFIVSIITILSLSSCQTDSKDTKFVIAFSQCTEGDAWRKTMREEMEREKYFHPGLDILWRDAKGDSYTQVKQIKELLTKDIDLLVVSPNEAEPITSIVEEAFGNGLPVVVFDRRINSNLYNAFIGADNFEIGKTAGQYVVEKLNGKGNILEVWGLPGSTPARDRHNGFLEAIKNYPEIRIIDSLNGQWNKDTAETLIRSKFDNLQDFDLIYAHNDQMALAAYEVSQDYMLQDSILFLGIDGLPGPHGGIQMVADGILNATLLYPTGGEKIVELSLDILRNQEYAKENLLNTLVIDSRNVRIMQLQANKILNQQSTIEDLQSKIEDEQTIYKNQKYFLFFLALLLVGALVLGVLTYKSLLYKKEANKQLETRNQEIVSQRNQILEMMGQLNEANDAKSKFFSNISNEFRTPLTLILGPVESLLNSFSSDENPSLKLELTTIQKNTLRLLRLVQQMMDFKNITKNKIQVTASENEFVGFIHNFISKIIGETKSYGKSIKLETTIQQLNLWIDPILMEQALLNIVLNILSQTDKEGQITFCT